MLNQAFGPRFAAFLVPLVASFGLITACPSSAAEDQETTRTWTGTWSNRKHNSSGTLKCIATKKDDQTAEARFEGTFMKDPFGYNVTVTTKSEKNQMSLEGTAQLDGDRYQWSGYVRGKTLYGTFRSLKGNNGEFRLEESTGK